MDHLGGTSRDGRTVSTTDGPSMTEPTDLVADQNQRWASLDPLLAHGTEPGPGRTVVATLADGSRVTAVLAEHHDRGQHVWTLTPFLGRHGGAGMDAVLRALRAHLDRSPPPADSVCTLTWPSRDADCVRPLLLHGLVPVLALGVRTTVDAVSRTTPNAVEVRPAEPDDAESVERLARQETEHSSLFSVSAPPNGHTEDAVTDALHTPGLIWVAERRDTAGNPVVGLIQLREVESDSPEFEGLLPAGRWGQIVRISVRPDLRGRGVGRALSTTAHAAFARAGLRRGVVWYSPLNPRASVFWHRQGYRPLWTVWQCSPASALR